LFLGGGGGREGLVSPPGGGGGGGRGKEVLGPGGSAWALSRLVGAVLCGVYVCVWRRKGQISNSMCVQAPNVLQHRQHFTHFCFFSIGPESPRPTPPIHTSFIVPSTSPPPPQGTALFCLLALGGMAIGVGYGLATSIWLEQVFR
jgi:hypothetical protein